MYYLLVILYLKFQKIKIYWNFNIIFELYEIGIIGKWDIVRIVKSIINNYEFY